MKNKLSLGLMILLVVGLSSCIGEQKENTTMNTEVVDEKLIDEVVAEILPNDDEYVVSKNDILEAGKIISDDVSGELSEEEKEGLIRMREEEKLAYDVYVTLYEKWNQKIFNNISRSEITHMGAVGELLIKYNIEDPIDPNAKVGEFTMPLIQKLYDDLVATGEKSLIDALKVGATIEDLDIYDLEEFLKETTNEDIINVYDNLLRGSRNHMRAFEKNLRRNVQLIQLNI